MAFENWSGKNRDVLRFKRLLISSSIGLFSLLAVFVGLIKYSPKALAEEVEEEAKVVEVELAKEPEPEPEPPPPPPELRPRQSNPGPRLQKLETPTTISDDKVQEKDAKPSSGGGDPYEKGSGDGTGGAEKAVVEAPAAAPPPAPSVPQVKKPVPVPENGTPPEAIQKLVPPEYPAEAKAAGLEGTVVVRYVVTEKGEVTDVRALKGPPELFAICVAAVKAMRFKPALDGDGKPLLVVRYMKFPFRLRT